MKQLKILNIAHRGYSGKFDENTMLAFKKAIEYNADGIETDVQLSKDNVPVIIHDEKLERTTNGYGFVKDYTLEELKKFKTKSVAHVIKRKSKMTLNYNLEEIKHFKECDGEEIPTLEELLCFVSSSNLKVLNLELKNNIMEYKGLEEQVLEMIEKYNLKDRIIISSFNHRSLVKLRKLDKTIKLGALTETTLVNVPDYLKQIEVQCYHPFYPSIFNEEDMKNLKANNIMVNPYTFNGAEEMISAMIFGADSVITNEVEEFNEVKEEFIKYNLNSILV